MKRPTTEAELQQILREGYGEGTVLTNGQAWGFAEMLWPLFASDPDQYNQVAHMIKRGYSTTFVRDAVQQLPDGEYILYVRDDTMPKIAQ